MSIDNVGRRDRESVLVAQFYTANSRGSLPITSHSYIAGLLAVNSVNSSNSITSELVRHLFDADSPPLAIAVSDSAYSLQATVDTVQLTATGWPSYMPNDTQESGFNINRFFFEIDGDMLNVSALKKDSGPISGGGFGGTGHEPVVIASKAADGGIVGTGNTGGSADGGMAGTGNAPVSSGESASRSKVAAGNVLSPDTDSEKSAGDVADAETVTSSPAESDSSKGADAGSVLAQVAERAGENSETSHMQGIWHETADSAEHLSGSYWMAHITYTPVDYATSVGEIFPV